MNDQRTGRTTFSLFPALALLAVLFQPAAALAAGGDSGGPDTPEETGDLCPVRGKVSRFEDVRRDQMDLVITEEIASGTPHRIRLQSREVVPERGIDEAAASAGRGSRAWVVGQRSSFPEDGDWEELASRGIFPAGYLGDLNWILFIDLERTALSEAFQAFGAKAFTALGPADKIDPELLAGNREDPSYDSESGLFQVEARFHRGSGRETAAQLAETFHQGREAAEASGDEVWKLELRPEDLLGLAQAPEIAYLSPSSRQIFPLMDPTRNLVNADVVQGIDTTLVPPGFDLSGVGVCLSNSEGIGGGTHEDFMNHDSAGNPTTVRSQTTSTSGGPHGMMTAGVMLGNGWLSDTIGGTPYQFRGIAPEAEFCAHNSAADAANFSFAQSPWGRYSNTNATTDERIRGNSFNHRYPHIGAVANQGLKIQYGTELGYYSVYRNSKNEIVVGNLRAGDGLWNGSSLGPTFDGRIKPDVSAPGSWGSFPRRENLGFDLDSVRLISVNGNQDWTFDSSGSLWHQGWGQGAWTWARHNITTPTQMTLGPDTVMHFKLKKPPWGTAWTNRPLIGQQMADDGVTPLDHTGHVDDVVEIRYRFEADPFWDDSQIIFLWFKDFPDWNSQASEVGIVVADGNWHTMQIPVGQDPDWGNEPSLRYVTLRFSSPQINAPANTQRYQGTGGSSAAAPVVAGTVGLLMEKLATDYGTILGDTSPSAFWTAAPGIGVPLPSTFKALVVHSASDIVRPAGVDPVNPDTGAATDYHAGPDYATGYGIVDIAAAVDLLDREQAGTQVQIYEDELGSSGFHSYAVPVPFTSSGPFKVTLAWDDFPGDPSSAEVVPKLVNNLDLLVRGPDGTFYFPWTLDLPYVPASPAEYPSQVEPEPITAADIHPARRDMPNHRDNVEQVLIDCATYGQYTVYVLANGMGAPPQGYSLVIERP